ncbi:MAG: enoyl-CoA hydratase-related protein [Gammaproteobacteria bacterium]|nr:enoyl-CoA hydratase-related protein [Gammaproteobacteria bacterium]
MAGKVLLHTDERGVATLTLNRPKLHNAFDSDLIAELTAKLDELNRDEKVRAVVLTGAGQSFCAGADLNWMRGMVEAGEEENLADAKLLAKLLRKLNFLPKPVLARVNGAAFGGGIGLIACCDIAIGVEQAKFSLSEVKLGLAPATIAPYVVAAIGLRQARRLFINGEIFTGKEAERVGLLHHCVEAEALDETLDRTLHLLLKGGPTAQSESKALALATAGMTPDSTERKDAANAALIARLRVSDEGQEGLGAFLEKRKPNWIK